MDSAAHFLFGQHLGNTWKLADGRTGKHARITDSHFTADSLKTAVVSCSLDVPRLGGVRLGSGTTGRLGRAWVGAWHSAWVHGGSDVVMWGWVGALLNNTNSTNKFRFEYYSSREITPDSAWYLYPSNSRIPSFFRVAQRGRVIHRNLVMTC